MADGCGGAFYIQATLMAAISGGSSLGRWAHRSSMVIIALLKNNNRYELSQPLRYNTWVRPFNHSILPISSIVHRFQKRGRGMKVLYDGLPFQ